MTFTCYVTSTTYISTFAKQNLRGIPATTFSWLTAGTLFELEVNIDVESVVAFLYPCVVVFLVGFTSFCEPWSQIFEEPTEKSIQ